jgi:hypothetical protein
VSLAAVFPFDPNATDSATSTVHSTASLVSFVAILAAMFVFTAASRTVPLWSSFSRLSAALAYTAAASLAIASATQGSLTFGVAQRTFLGAVVVWLAAAGVCLSRSGMPEVRIDSLCQAFEAFNHGDVSRCWLSVMPLLPTIGGLVPIVPGYGDTMTAPCAAAKRAVRITDVIRSPRALHSELK